MKFYSRELSQKLQDMGCVNESGFVYYQDEHCSTSLGQAVLLRFRDKIKCDAFTPYDFCGPSETARKNAEIRWPSKLCIYCKEEEGHEYHKFYTDERGMCNFKSMANVSRHVMIDLSEEEQEAYMERNLK